MADLKKENIKAEKGKSTRFLAPSDGVFPSFSLSSLAKSSSVSRALIKVACILSVGISLTALVCWVFFPAQSMRLMMDAWIIMSLQEAIVFSLLGGALLYYDRYPLLLKGRMVMWTVGGAVCFFILIHPLLITRGDFVDSPFSAMGLFVLGFVIAMSPGVMRRPRMVGHILGVTILILLTVFVYFFITYCHGVRLLFESGIPCPFCPGANSLLSGGIPCPRLMSVLSVVLLAGAVLGTLGPRHFPIRSFVGPTARAALLRRLMPVSIASVLIFLTVQGSLPKFLSPSLTSFLTLCMTSLLVVYLVLRSSSVVSVQLESALKESEQRYWHLVEGLRDHAVLLLDPRGAILVWNPGAERITGYKASEVTMEPLSHLVSGKDSEFNFDKIFAHVIDQGSFQMEGWVKSKDGNLFWAETSLSKLADDRGQMIGMSVIIRDSTRRRNNEESMKASLLEKEVLLKEIHHRVKNNLQVISSLLRLQADAVPDKKTADLFLDSQERVRAMAMVHEYLYKSPDLARINFSAYVASLVRNLYRTFGLTSSANPPTVDVDDVLLSLDVAVPCGLLLTELVTNAVKYAYPDKKTGPVHIRFRNLTEGGYELSVTDEGVGFPDHYDWAKSNSLGLRLVRLLTEQLQGTIQMESRPGIKFVVTFKDQVA